MERNAWKSVVLSCFAAASLAAHPAQAAAAAMSASSDLATVTREIEAGADVNGRYECEAQFGCKTYLSRAASRGELDVIRYLVKKGAKLNEIGMFNQT